MKKAGPKNEAMAHIVELDKQLRALVSGAVVNLSDVRSQYKHLRQMRRDNVRVIESSN